MARFRALPYAKALHEVMTDTDAGRAEQVADELDRFAAVIEQVPDFQRVLTTPMVSPDTKTRILDEVLDSLEIVQPTRRFLHVVQRHFRTEHMRHIAQAYRDLVDRAFGRTRATVEVASALDDGQRRAILSVISDIVGRDVVADFEGRPELLAGFRVQVGSKVFDGSLTAQVDRLSRGISRE